MHVIIIIELIRSIVSLILAFQSKLIPMFFHMNLIRKIRNSI
jgi:hypothetical protein